MVNTKYLHRSICVLTGVRIQLALHLDYSDATYNLIDFGLLSYFEFYLGNITACLPLLSPAISQIASSMQEGVFSNAFSWPRHSTRRLISKVSGSKSLKDTNAGNVPDTSGDQGFERIDDLGYPLVSNPHVKNNVTASFDDDPLPPLPRQIHQDIHVTSGFSSYSNKIPNNV